MKNGVELVLRNLKVYTFVGAQLRGWLRKFLCDVTLVSLSSMFNALVTEAFDRVMGQFDTEDNLTPRTI